jgi:hypothetical protein
MARFAPPLGLANVCCMLTSISVKILGPVSLLVVTTRQRSSTTYDELLVRLQAFGQLSASFPTTQSNITSDLNEKSLHVATWLDLHLLSLDPSTSTKGFPNTFLSLSRFFAPDDSIVLFPSLRHISSLSASDMLQLLTTVNISTRSLFSSNDFEHLLSRATVFSSTGPYASKTDLGAFNLSDSLYLYDPYAPLLLHKTSPSWCPERSLAVGENRPISYDHRPGSPPWQEVEEQERRLHWSLCLFRISLDSSSIIQRLTVEPNLRVTYIL